MLPSIRNMWTSLLAVGVPTALFAVGWAIFMGGRPVAGELAGCYLLIVIAGRAQAAERERRRRPHHEARVRTQLERIQSTLVFDDLAAVPREAIVESLMAVAQPIPIGELGARREAGAATLADPHPIARAL